MHDAGLGIPTDIAAILIDPDPGPAVRAGRGLGLWMVRRMVDELGGTVTIAEMPDGGTIVTLLLPAAREEARQMLPERARIGLVEDGSRHGRVNRPAAGVGGLGRVLVANGP